MLHTKVAGYALSAERILMGDNARETPLSSMAVPPANTYSLCPPPSTSIMRDSADSDSLKVDTAYTHDANLRFRSITTMLRAFRANQDRQFPIVDPAETKNLKLQRQVLTALATLFVKNYEIVAVAWKSGSPAATAVNFEDDIPIEYIAIQNAPITRSLPTKHPPGKPLTDEGENHVWQACTQHRAPNELPFALKNVLQLVLKSKNDQERAR